MEAAKMADMEVQQQLQPVVGAEEVYGHKLPPILTTAENENSQEEDREQDHDDHHSKKSVLAKVKEKALKWKNTITKKMHGHDKGNETPLWEGNLDEEEKEEDPQYHGAPMYESEMATETYKDTSSPRTAITDELKQSLAHETNDSGADHRINEDLATNRTYKEHKELLLHHINTPNTQTSTPDKELATPKTPGVRKAPPFLQANSPTAFNSPSKELAMKHADQLAMHYLDEFEASSPRYKKTHAKFEGTVSDNISDATREEDRPTETNVVNKEGNVLEAGVISKDILEKGDSKLTEETSPDAKEQGLEAKVIDKDPANEHGSNKTLTETVTEMLAPAYTMVTEATHAIASKIHRPTAEDETGAKMTYDKGVSVKEYLMHKLEPGEDERVLSKAITEAISPRKATSAGESGVVEKVRNAVSTLLRKEGNEGSPIPISTNPHAVEVEELGGRRLQASAN